MYKPGGTIAAALEKIQSKAYVLPAIQREFVWKPEQIERLFDSLMQGYPFGTFLFWTVGPETSGKFKFYDFVLNYHQRDAAHCPELPKLHNQTVTAVLDGQQRLTALNIGLRGSLALKQPYKRMNNSLAFPKKTLHLNLLASPQPDEDGVVYKFRFLSEDQIVRDDASLWFPVPDILGMKGGPPMLAWLTANKVEGDALNVAYTNLDRLHQVVHNEPCIFYYEEGSQDIERVLNIFIRLNSGGTVLSYSDLLLSIAVAQWKIIDARQEIHSLVDEINDVGAGFSLSQDFVLKAGLMLSDIASVGFKVENFTQTNMQKLEKNWTEVRKALVSAAELAANFGLSWQTLRADSALLPIAYYLYMRGSPKNFVTAGKYAADREAIRSWLMRSLLKTSGIWGSGLDTLLTALRDVLKKNGDAEFPVEKIEKVMDQRGKSLAFSDIEIDDLLSVSYGEQRAFPLLTMLFPFVDLRNHFHVDHVFPISLFTMKKLKKAGFSEDQADELWTLANEISNLQLLEGHSNIEKKDKLPADWLTSQFANSKEQKHYCEKYVLGKIPLGIDGFEKFHIARRERLSTMINTVLGIEKA